MKEYTLDYKRDKEFLSFPRKDYISQEPIKSGDTIVVCDKCNTIMKNKYYIENDKKCGKCESEKLKDINQQYLKSLDVKAKKVQERHPRQKTSSNSSFGEYYSRHEKIKDDFTTSPATSNRNPQYARGTDKFPNKREKRNYLGRILLILVIVAIVAGIAFAINAFASTNSNDYTTSAQADDFENIEPETLEEPVIEELNVSNITPNEITIDDAFVGEEIYIEEENSECFYGYISEDSPESEYIFTAPRDGRYQFDLKDMMATASARLIVYDDNEERLIDTYNASGYTKLYSGKSYRVLVKHYSGESDFLLEIGVPKSTTDISNSSTIYDQVSFENQINKYEFTVPVSGRYRFDLTEVNSNVSLRLMIWDDKDNSVIDTYDLGQYAVLDEGKTYSIQVRQYSNLGSYCMKIGFQKPSTDITGYTVIRDSIEYEDQKNVYYFRAPLTGRYRFYITETNANNTYRLMAWDNLENSILDTYDFGNYIDLEEGETYTIQVRHYSGFDSYTLNIGYQKEKTDISRVDIVHDSITFEDQENIYNYIPNESKDYTFYFTDYSADCCYRLIIRDEYKNELADTYNGEATVTFESGKQYTIKVIQYSGLGDYSLNIT